MGQKSFLRGVEIGSQFGDVDPYGRIKRDKFHRRSTILQDEEDDYSEFKSKVDDKISKLIK